MTAEHKRIQFRVTTELNSDDVKTLVEEGPKLFQRLQETTESRIFLDYNPKLKEVIRKW
jgi:hypothetical protein